MFILFFIPCLINDRIIFVNLLYKMLYFSLILLLNNLIFYASNNLSFFWQSKLEWKIFFGAYVDLTELLTATKGHLIILWMKSKSWMFCKVNKKSFNHSFVYNIEWYKFAGNNFLYFVVRKIKNFPFISLYRKKRFFIFIDNVENQNLEFLDLFTKKCCYE